MKATPRAKKTPAPGGTEPDGLLFEHNPLPMWVYDLETYGFLAVNHAAVQHYGWSEAEFKKMTLRDIRPPEDVNRLLEDLEQERPNLQDSGAWRHLLKDGSVIEVEIHSHTLEYHGRKAALVVALNVTERKLAEQALRSSEEQYRSVVEDINELICRFLPDGRLTYVNDSYCRYYGKSREELIGTSFIPSAAADFPQKLRDYFNSFTPDRPTSRFEQYDLLPNGEKRWREWMDRAIFDESGRLLEFQSTGRDITERKLAEEALRENEIRLKEAQKLGRIGNWIFDVESQTIAWSDQVYELYERDPALGPPTEAEEAAYYSAEQAQVLREYGRRAIVEGLSFQYELEAHLPSGRPVFFYAIMQPIQDSQGRVVSLFGTVQDITERKRANDELRNSEERFRALIKNGRDNISLLAADGALLWESPSEYSALGYAHDQFVGRNIFELMHPDDLSWTQAMFEQVVQTPGDTREGTFRLRHSDGSWRWIEATAANLLNEPHVQAVVINYRDVTGHKQAEAELHLRGTALESTANAIVITGVDGNIHWINPAYTRLTGYSLTEVLGRKPRILNSGTHDKAFYKTLWDTILSGQPWKGEMINKRKDGSLYFEEQTITPLIDASGKITHFIAVQQDITEQRRAQDALAGSEAKLRAVFAAMQDVVLILDREGVYQDIAPTKPGLLYKPPEELLGMSLAEIFPPQEAGHFLSVIREAMDSGQLQQIEYQLQIGNANHWFSANVTPMSEDFVVWVARDTTNRKQSEEKIKLQLKRLSALKDIDHAIASSVDLKFNLSRLIDHVVAELNVDASAILTVNPNLNMLEYVAKKGFRGEESFKQRLLIGEDFAGKSARENRIIHIPDLSKTARHSMMAYLSEKQGFVSYWAIPLIAKGTVKGVLEVFHRSALDPDADWHEFLETLAGQAAIAIETLELFGDLKLRNLELISAYDATIEGWSQAMDLRDKETEGHTQRVTELTVKLATALGMSENEIVHIRRGALLHDIGKLGVPDSILIKPDKLTEEEWVIMKRHPQLAYDMLHTIEYLRPALEIPYCHHEKWDGSGYPRGLKGEQIPLAARLFAVVDVWDALRSVRPYREGWSKDKTLAYILGQAGRHFDPSLLDVFINIIKHDNGRNP